MTATGPASLIRVDKIWTLHDRTRTNTFRIVTPCVFCIQFNFTIDIETCSIDRSPNGGSYVRRLAVRENGDAMRKMGTTWRIIQVSNRRLIQRVLSGYHNPRNTSAVLIRGVILHPWSVIPERWSTIDTNSCYLHQHQAPGSSKWPFQPSIQGHLTPKKVI